MEAALEKAMYPIGRYKIPERYDPEMQNEWINEIEALPNWLDHVIENLDAAQLETPYREGGWNIRQVIHHIADSHMNGYIRQKLALTEDNPVIKPYDENRWVMLPDVEKEPVNMSITLLHALHRRWGTMLRNLEPADWERVYYHPEDDRVVPLWASVDTYAWHGRHHMEHVRSLRERMGW